MKLKKDKLKETNVRVDLNGGEFLLKNESYLESLLSIHQILELMLQILLYHFKRGVHGREQMDEVKWNLISNLSFSRLLRVFEEFEETKKEIPISKLSSFNKFRNEIVHEAILMEGGVNKEKIKDEVLNGISIARELRDKNPSWLNIFD